MMKYQAIQRRFYEFIYESRQPAPDQSFQNHLLIWTVIVGLIIEVLKSWVSPPVASAIVILILISTWLFLCCEEKRREPAGANPSAH